MLVINLGFKSLQASIIQNYNTFQNYNHMTNRLGIILSIEMSIA